MSIHAQLQVRYSGFALDVALDLPGRGVTAVFGPSGCGKTTLLRCLAGLTQAHTGKVVVNGEVWQDAQRFVPVHERRVGVVFQDTRLFDHLTVQGNLRFGQSRTPVALQQVQWDQAVALLGIGHLLTRKPHGLSGGERQRVAIARALLTSPQLLLLDEPMASLDVARRDEFMPYLERLHRELDMPVLLVSHAPDEVARLADHIVVMAEGRAIASGPLGETLARIDLPIRLGEDAGVVLEARIAERDAQWHLARVEFAGGELWVRDAGHAVRQSVRVRILARDVSIALAQVQGSSILNGLPAVVEQIGTDGHPASALVRLSVGASSLVARVTQRSVSGLALVPGKPVWVQIKAVALLG